MEAIAAPKGWLAERVAQWRNEPVKFAAMALTAAFLAALIAYPFLTLFHMSVKEPETGAWTLASYARIFTEESFREAFYRSIWLGLLVTFFSLLIGDSLRNVTNLDVVRLQLGTSAIGAHASPRRPRTWASTRRSSSIPRATRESRRPGRRPAARTRWRGSRDLMCRPTTRTRSRRSRSSSRCTR